MNVTYRIPESGDPAAGGPYTEEDLLDLLEAGELSPDTVCENLVTGRKCRAAELFEVIPADGPAPSVEEAAEGSAPVPWRPAEMPEGDDAEPPRRDTPRIIYAGHPALLTYWRSLGAGLLLIAAGWYAGQWNGMWIAGGLLAGGLWIVAVLLLRTCHEYVIDTRRVETREGILAKSSREIRIQDIRAINVEKSGLTGLLGIGSVEFASAGSGDQDVTFRQVAGADAIKAAVRRLQD